MTASASEVIGALIDPGTWASWDLPIEPSSDGADQRYSDQRRRAAHASGADEAVLTGEASIGGIRAAFLVGEFGYLAGSIGHDAADRIIAAYLRAATDGLPVIAAPVSGGTRMQEGTPAFLRMAGIAAAVADFRSCGQVCLVLLRGPTTGGVFATWGSLGHVTIAEPDALVGFLGPRVFAEVTGQPFPEGVQTSENLLRHGVIDGVAPVDAWRDIAVRLLSVTSGEAGILAPGVALPAQERQPAPHPDPSAWEHVLATREADRAGAADWLAACATDVLELPGTGAGERAEGLIVALARVGGRGTVVVAQDRVAQRQGHLIGPWSLRSARRAMDLAEALRLPLVTVIDTSGAELSPAAEEGAMAGEIARCLADLSRLPVPTVSVLLGQGCGGGAIALLPCDAVVAAGNAWVTPLPPEGAAAIVHRDAGRAPQMAAEQRITAQALAAIGAVDVVVEERGEWLDDIGRAVSASLDDLASAGTADLLHRRRARWRDAPV